MTPTRAATIRRMGLVLVTRDPAQPEAYGARSRKAYV
jgi:hypothetical protein